MKSKSSATKKTSSNILRKSSSSVIKKTAVDWPEAIKPLLKKYKNKKHPLDYKNVYQLLVMVVLSAQDSDRHINKISPALFAAFPNMETLSKATFESLHPFIHDVRNSWNKGKWIIEMAQE